MDEEILHFLKEFSWVYDYKNTEFFHYRPFDRLPSEVNFEFSTQNFVQISKFHYKLEYRIYNEGNFRTLVLTPQ